MDLTIHVWESEFSSIILRSTTPKSISTAMKISATFCLAIATTLAASIQRRAVIAHDAVVGFSQTVPSGTVGQLYLKYKPYLKVENGCVPFPAVDASGNTGYEL